MKGQMQKKLVIGLLTIGIVGGLGLSVYTTKHMNDETTDDIKQGQVSGVEDKKDKKKDEKPEEVVILNPMDGKDSEPVEGKKKTIKSYEIATAEQDAREYFRNFKFEEGTTLLNDFVSKYELDGDAKILKDLQYDGALLMNLVPHDDHGGHSHHTREGVAFDQGILNVMKGLKDAESTLLGTLYLDHEERERVIMYDGSLNPVYEEGQPVRVIDKTTVEIPHEIGVMYPETVTYHKLTFILDGFNLHAYVLESKDGNMALYTIEDPAKEAHYYTITQWKKIRSNMEKGLPALEGVLELNTDEETYNTEEVVTEEKSATDDTTETDVAE